MALLTVFTFFIIVLQLSKSLTNYYGDLLFTDVVVLMLAIFMLIVEIAIKTNYNWS